MKVNELMIDDWFSFNNTFHRVSALKGVCCGILSVLEPAVNFIGSLMMPSSL